MKIIPEGYTKSCRLCGSALAAESFYRDATMADGLWSACRSCVNAVTRAKRQSPEYRDRFRASDARYYASHKEEKLARQRAKYPMTKEYWRKRNRARKTIAGMSIIEYRRLYRLKNLNKMREISRKYNVQRRRLKREKVLSVQRAYRARNKMLSILRCRFYGAIKYSNAKKYESIRHLIGIGLNDYKKYIESKFKPGMSWENYGKKGWHIDHIRPCISFNLSDEEQQKQCFHYTNTQPLWETENLSKGGKYQPSLAA